MMINDMSRRLLYDDLYRYEGERASHWLVKLRYLFFVPGFTYTFFFRRASAARNALMRAFWLVPLQVTRYLTHIQIPLGTRIGRGLRIVHFGHVVINPAATIGENFTISQGCLVGSALGKREGVPVIGDSVYMSANSVIIGKVIIGNDVMIAPGALVNFDVPDNSVVIGNPGQIIPRDESPTRKYIVYSVYDRR